MRLEEKYQTSGKQQRKKIHAVHIPILGTYLQRQTNQIQPLFSHLQINEPELKEKQLLSVSFKGNLENRDEGKKVKTNRELFPSVGQITAQSRVTGGRGITANHFKWSSFCKVTYYDVQCPSGNTESWEAIVWLSPSSAVVSLSPKILQQMLRKSQKSIFSHLILWSRK